MFCMDTHIRPQKMSSDFYYLEEIERLRNESRKSIHQLQKCSKKCKKLIESYQSGHSSRSDDQSACISLSDKGQEIACMILSEQKSQNGTPQNTVEQIEKTIYGDDHIIVKRVNHEIVPMSRDYEEYASSSSSTITENGPLQHCPSCSDLTDISVDEKCAFSNSHTVPSCEDVEYIGVRKRNFTVPEPFTMTLRDEMKMKILEEKLSALRNAKEAADMKQDISELSKKFKATPLPSTTFEPRCWRADSPAGSKKVTKVRPFSFDGRDSKVRDGRRKCIEEDPQPTFKARPAPAYSHNDTWVERNKEEALYRQKRREAHSKELLKTASYPPRMEKQLRDKSGLSKSLSSLIPAKPSFHPKISKRVPDFKRIHEVELVNSTVKSKHDTAYGTVFRPFSFETEKRMQLRRRQMEDDPESKTRKSQPKLRRSRSLDYITSRLYQRRPQPTRIETLQPKPQLGGRMKKQLTNIHTNCRETEAEIERRRKMKCQQLAIRQRAYKRELESIKKKLEDRPLLMERAALESQRKAAEKQFAQTLKQAGLPDCYVQKLCASSNMWESGETMAEALTENNMEYSNHIENAENGYATDAASYTSISDEAPTESDSDSESVSETETGK